MTPEQHLIQQIEQVLASVQLERNPVVEDLAVQFSELCENANARLIQCLDFLDKGMRSEAVNEARNSPNLLELDQLFQTASIKKWRNLCVDLELTVSHPLNEKALERLKAAVVQEQELEPLLKSYRRAVYLGDRHGCIEQLRRIRACDPDNPNWSTNLQPLEEEELPELIRRAEIALAGGVLTEIGVLYAELNHPQRAAKAPESLLDRMRRKLMAKEATELRREGAELVVELEKALDATDEPRMEGILQKMSALEGQEAFLEQPVGWAEAKSKVAEWQDLQERRREKQAKFHEALDAFQALLSKGKLSDSELRREWERLQEWELPISDLLERQVVEILAEHATRGRRIRAILVTCVLLLLLGGGAFGGYVFYQRKMQERRDAALEHLHDLMDKKQYKEFLYYLDNVKRDLPEVASGEECEDMLRTVRKIQEQEAEREKRYRSAMDELGRIRDREYEGFGNEAILKQLANAEEVVKEIGKPAYQEAVRNWRDGWQEWQQRRRKNANDGVRRPVSLVKSALSEQQRNPYRELSQAEQKIRELRNELKTAEPHLPLADEELRREYGTVREQLDAWERSARASDAAARKQAADFRRIQDAIARQGGNLKQYKIALEQYVKAAPPQDSLRRDYSAVLDMFEIYEQAASLGYRDFSLPLDDSGVAQVTELLGKGGLGRTPWASELRRACAYTAAQKALASKMMELVISSKPVIELYYIEYRLKGESEWKRLYVPALLHSGTDPDDPSVRRYWGNVYHWTSQEPTPRLMHTKEAFPEYEFSTQRYDIRQKANREDNRVPYGAFVTSFVANADQKDIFMYLLNGIERVLNEPGIETPLKALFVKKALSMLADAYAGVLPEAKSVSDAFAGIDTTVPWMNPQHPAVVAMTRSFDETIAKMRPRIAALKQALQDRMRLTEWILRCGVTPAGSVQTDASGRMILRINAGNPKEVWGISRAAQNAMPVFCLISKDGRTISADAKRYCIPGMPVFIPRRNYGVLNANLNRKGLSRPDAWPTNAW